MKYSSIFTHFFQNQGHLRLLEGGAGPVSPPYSPVRTRFRCMPLDWTCLYALGRSTVPGAHASSVPPSAFRPTTGGH